MNEINQNVQQIQRKMDVIISLLLRIANNGNEQPLKEQVRDLASFGLSTTEIAGILGKKAGHISKELSLIKKESK